MCTLHVCAHLHTYTDVNIHTQILNKNTSRVLKIIVPVVLVKFVLVAPTEYYVQRIV